MHYILDGYNIIYRLPQFNSGGTIKSETGSPDREKLTKYLYKEKKHLIKKNQISVVFDGKNNFVDWQSGSRTAGEIQILFSPRQGGADDYIVEIVKRAEKPQFITVVTDDKELQTRVRMLSAFAIGVDEFFSSNKKETKEEGNKPSLTYKDLEEIKEELVRQKTE